MNFVNSRCLLVVFVYFSAAVLVIVDGQSTTDDDSDKYEISSVAKLEGYLASAVARISKLEGKLAVAVDRIAELEGQSAAPSRPTAKPNECKFSCLCIYIIRVTCVQPSKISRRSVAPLARNPEPDKQKIVN